MSKELQKLSGGYINEVYKENGHVTKHFSGDDLVGQDHLKRRLREMLSLQSFGGKLSPKFMGFDPEGNLLEEFLPGTNVELLAMKGEKIDFCELGSLLKQIHVPVRRDNELLSKAFVEKLAVNVSKSYNILESEGLLDTTFNVDWKDIYERGSTRVHRDFWMGNLMTDGHSIKAIDWEFSGLGTPYEDFAVVDLWMFREYSHTYPNLREEFWEGYGNVPLSQNTDAFLKARLIEFLATTTLEQYRSEENGGFYHNKVDLLRTLNESSR